MPKKSGNASFLSDIFRALSNNIPPSQKVLNLEIFQLESQLTSLNSNFRSIYNEYHQAMLLNIAIKESKTLYGKVQVWLFGYFFSCLCVYKMIFACINAVFQRYAQKGLDPVYFFRVY